MTPPKPRRSYRRLSRYPVSLHAMIPEDTASEIDRLAELARWPSAEVVRRALEAGLPSVATQLAGREAEQ